MTTQDDEELDKLVAHEVIDLWEANYFEKAVEVFEDGISTRWHQLYTLIKYSGDESDLPIWRAHIAYGLSVLILNGVKVQ